MDSLRQIELQIIQCKKDKKNAKKAARRWIASFEKRYRRAPNIEERIISPQCHLFNKAKELSNHLKHLELQLQMIKSTRDRKHVKSAHLINNKINHQICTKTLYFNKLTNDLIKEILHFFDGLTLCLLRDHLMAGTYNNSPSVTSKRLLGVVLHHIETYRNYVDININMKYLNKFRYGSALIIACEIGHLNDVKDIIMHHTLSPSSNKKNNIHNDGKTNENIDSNNILQTFNTNNPFDLMLNGLGRNSAGKEYSPLMIAAAKEHIYVVHYLLNQQKYAAIDLGVVDANGNNVLHYVCGYNTKSIHLLNMLLHYYYDNQQQQCHDNMQNDRKSFIIDDIFINRRNYNGKSPLDWIIAFNKSKIKDQLIASIEQHGGKRGNDVELTNLMFAVKYEKLDQCIDILKQEEDKLHETHGSSFTNITYVTSNGWNALHYAAWKSKCNVDILNLLLNHASNIFHLDLEVFINKADDYGNTPLNLAFVNHSSIKDEIIDLLILYGGTRGRL